MKSLYPMSFLIVFAIGTFALMLFTDDDVNTLVSALLDIMTTMIGALVGYIAGKGQGRADAVDDLVTLSEAREREHRSAARSAEAGAVT